MNFRSKVLAALSLSFAMIGLIFAAPSMADMQSNAVRICGQAAQITAPLDTNEDTLAICNLPPLGPNSRIEISGTFTYTNSANNKTLRVRYSGASGTQYLTTVKTTTAITSFIIGIANRGVQNSQVSLGDNAGLVYSAAATAVVTSAVDTSVPTTIFVTCQKATGAEACSLENLNVLLYP